MSAMIKQDFGTEWMYETLSYSDFTCNYKSYREKQPNVPTWSYSGIEIAFPSTICLHKPLLQTILTDQ